MSKPTKFLKDYAQSPFLIPKVELEIELAWDKSTVRTTMSIQRQSSSQTHELLLHGKNQVLLELQINGERIKDFSSWLTEEGLKIPAKYLQEDNTITVHSTHSPSSNHSLQGLYTSDHILCTQCEPQGFRNITYFLDRPDIMSVYTVRLKTDEAHRFPSLLSNGNCIERILQGNYLEVCWHDPHPKPSYLFAIVAGKFDLLCDSYTTTEGKEIELEIYTPLGQKNRAQRAMHALKTSMRWDELNYKRSYDLNKYMIVAVNSFNAGAMENKGLNIFNAPYVLADNYSSTDQELQNIDRVIAHEYFHNWTGNRITLRDWFQLTLKEGLTVFRDQQFSEDIHDRATRRIAQVKFLRERQFAEDQGPTSHPIQPKQYDEIDNFYTVTVYDKGAEVIRMLHTLLGKDKYNCALQEYFSRYDGQAITTEDFLNTLQGYTELDLTPFKLWYDQKGTPQVKSTWQQYSQNSWELTLTQSLKNGPENTKPMLMPIRIAFYSDNGKELKLCRQGQDCARHEWVLDFKKREERFIFEGSAQRPVLSLNRFFSAPIEAPLASLSDLQVLCKYDKDPVNRWNAFQTIVYSILKEAINTPEKKLDPKREAVIFIQKTAINLAEDETLSSEFRSLLLSMPSDLTLSQDQNPIEFEHNTHLSKQIKSIIAEYAPQKIQEIYQSIQGSDLCMDNESMGKRSLKNTLLDLLCSLNTDETFELAHEQYSCSTNMTLRLGALKQLIHGNDTRAQHALEHFYAQHHKDSLVSPKWLYLQASSPFVCVDEIETLKQDPVFNKLVPNDVRALLGTFCQNLFAFHKQYELSYPWLRKTILEFDQINPHIAAALCAPFKLIARLDSLRKEAMYEELKQLNTQKLSVQTNEILQNCIKFAT